MKNIATLLMGILLSFGSVHLSAQPAASTRPASSNAIQWNSNYSDAVKQAQASSKPILILFTGSTWCPACMKLEREVLSRPEFAQAIGDKYIFVKAEFLDATGNSPYSSLLQRYHVSSFPTMVIVDANERPLFTLGYQPGGARAYIQQLTQRLGQ